VSGSRLCCCSFVSVNRPDANIPGTDVTHSDECKLITVFYVIVKGGKTRAGDSIINLSRSVPGVSSILTYVLE
jgi:hypothetical protein